MELLGNNPSMQDLIEKLNEVVGSLNNSLPNTDSEIAEVKKLVSFGSGVLAGRLNAKLWYFKTQELMTASTELCEGDSCFVLKDGATTGEGTFEYWYIYKTSDVVDIIDSYVDLSNPDLVAVKLQDMTLKDVKDTLSAQISDQSKDLNTKISNLRTDTETALSGKADLVNGLIPASQLPSYVDDIVESWLEDIEFPENAYAKEDTEMTTPLTPEFSKIYVNLLNNKTYRWGGNFYVEVSKSLAIGETSTTAFAGDRGKNLEEKISKTLFLVTPQLFGAKGDGVTDDSSAFQLAINSGASYVYIPSGKYVVNSLTISVSNLKIFGDFNKSMLISSQESPIITILESTNLIISQLAFYCKNASNAIKLSDNRVNMCQIKNNWFFDFKDFAIDLESPTGYVYIEQNRFFSSCENCCYLKSGYSNSETVPINYIYIWNNYFESGTSEEYKSITSRCAIEINSGTLFDIRDNDFANWTSEAIIKCIANSQGIFDLRIYNNIFYNITASKCIQLQRKNSGVIFNNVNIYNNEFFGNAGGCAIEINKSTDFFVFGVQIGTNTYRGTWDLFYDIRYVYSLKIELVNMTQPNGDLLNKKCTYTSISDLQLPNLGITSLQTIEAGKELSISRTVLNYPASLNYLSILLTINHSSGTGVIISGFEKNEDTGEITIKLTSSASGPRNINIKII